MIDTATVSYEQCKREGLLGDRQYQVLTYIMRNQEEFPQGISRGDVARFFNDTRTGYARRVQELEVAGILTCVGTKMDPHTGRPVKAYKLTGLIPTERVSQVLPSTTVQIKTYWCQDAQARLGPFLTKEAADSKGIDHEMPETVMHIATAQKA